jgi:protein-tyrosine phosphatase
VPDQVAAEPLQIPGIKYRNINFNGKAYSNMLISKLTWWQFVKLVCLMAVGYRVQAIRIIGENVMREKGLIGLGIDSIDACTAEVKEFFEVLAAEKNYPVMVHCTQGKDRTGLTVLLVLLLIGVSLEAAEHDYMITQKELVSERKERVKEINAIGLPDSFADCDLEFVKEIDRHVLEKYGGVVEYLEHAGVSLETQEAVKGNLITTLEV